MSKHLMAKCLFLSILTLVGFAIPVESADVVLFKNHNKGNPKLGINAGRKIPHLGESYPHFNDQCSDLVLNRDGLLVVLHEDGNHEGRALVLDAKNTRGHDMRRWSDKISSVAVLGLSRQELQGSVRSWMMLPDLLHQKDRIYDIRLTRKAEVVKRNIEVKLGKGGRRTNRSSGRWERLEFNMKNPRRPILHCHYVMDYRRTRSGGGSDIELGRFWLKADIDLRSNSPIENSVEVKRGPVRYQVDVPTVIGLLEYWKVI